MDKAEGESTKKSSAKSKIEVEVIDLKQKREDFAIIFIYQPKWEAKDWKEIENTSLCSLKEIKKADDIVRKVLQNAQKHNPSVIIFPELSVPKSSIQSIKNWSKKCSTIVISGSHYHKTKAGHINRTPVIAQGKVYYSEKIYPSHDEKSPIRTWGCLPGTNFKVFKNTTIGNFAVFICSDYLHQTFPNNIIEEYDLDLAFVPAFQKDSKIYHKTMDLHCQKSENGLYLIYCNNILSGFGDGKSALFGILDNNYKNDLIGSVTDGNPANKLFQFSEQDSHAVIKVDLKKKKTSRIRTIHSGPNVTILFPEVKKHTTEQINNKKKASRTSRQAIKPDDEINPDPAIVEKVRIKIREIFQGRGKHISQLEQFFFQEVKHIKNDRKIDVSAQTPEDLLIHFGPIESIRLLTKAVMKCIESVRDKNENNTVIIDDIRRDSKKIVGYLVLLSANKKRIMQIIKKNNSGGHSSYKLEVPARRESEIEIFYSIYSESDPTFVLKKDQNRLWISGEHGKEIMIPEVGFSPEDNVKEIVKAFWTIMNPGTKPSKQITEDDIKELNVKLRDLNRDRTNVYIIVKKTDHPLNNYDNFKAVTDKLSINILFMQFSESDSILIIPSEDMESRLKTFFLNIGETHAENQK